MRTTVTIDNDVLAVAKALAERNGTSLGRALSELARRGFRGMPPTPGLESGAVFDVPPDARPITSEDVRSALTDWP